MKEYWVDFSASRLVSAENEDEARAKFCIDIPCDFEFVAVDSIERAYESGEDD